MEKKFDREIVDMVLDEHVDKLIEEISNVQNTGMCYGLYFDCVKLKYRFLVGNIWDVLHFD